MSCVSHQVEACCWSVAAGAAFIKWGTHCGYRPPLWSLMSPLFMVFCCAITAPWTIAYFIAVAEINASARRQQRHLAACRLFARLLSQTLLQIIIASDVRRTRFTTLSRLIVSLLHKSCCIGRVYCRCVWHYRLCNYLGCCCVCITGCPIEESSYKGCKYEYKNVIYN